MSTDRTPRPPGRQRRDLERYAALFSRRTQVMRSSAMRDLMALTERPEVISLAGGLPATSTFPPELYVELHRALADAGDVARALQYGPTEGLAAARGAAAAVMAAEGALVDPENLIVTTGGQQVIDLVCKTLLDPGDVVIAEGPTYPGAVPTFMSYQADVVQIDMDADGMRVDEMEAALDRLQAEGRRPKFIYTIPNFQNPGGVTLSLARRERLVRIARERELLVLEDNPYGLLRYAGEPLAPLYALDGGEFVIYAGTFSKILSPGLRLGWAAAPRPVLEKMNLGKQASDLCSSSFTQMFVARYFGTSDWRAYIERLCDLYRRRCEVMLEALAEHMPRSAQWTRPQGGLFVWVTLPDFIDTTDLLALALDQNVAFVPGRAAFLDGRGGSSMRLNFSGVGEEQIREGVRRIGKVVAQQVFLYETLTGAAGSTGSGSAAGSDPGSRVEPAPAPEPASNVHELPRRARGSDAAGGRRET